MTLRRRSARLLAEIAELPPSAWRKVPLDVPHRKYRTHHVYEQKAKPAQRTFRQFFIKDLGHDEPTILLTNHANATAHQLITRCAKRMLIENALADAVRFFHIDALSSSVGLKVDFDMALLVLASGLYRMMAGRMRGYDDARQDRSSATLSTCPPTSSSPIPKSGCGFIIVPPPHRPRLRTLRQTRPRPVVRRTSTPIGPVALHLPSR
jgi:hypothetical protein